MLALELLPTYKNSSNRRFQIRNSCLELLAGFQLVYQLLIVIELGSTVLSEPLSWPHAITADLPRRTEVKSVIRGKEVSIISNTDEHPGLWEFYKEDSSQESLSCFNGSTYGHEDDDKASTYETVILLQGLIQSESKLGLVCSMSLEGIGKVAASTNKEVDVHILNDPKNKSSSPIDLPASQYYNACR